MLYEFCTEDVSLIPFAKEAGAERVELCADLKVGGLTPDPNRVVEALLQGLPIVLMIRPRGGNFVYSKDEIDEMIAQIQGAKGLGITSFVFGALLEDGNLDKNNLLHLLEAVGEDEAVFHMAFDQIPWDQRLEALDWLAEAGFKRILTHGGPQTKNLFFYEKEIDQIITRAAGKIDILLGGGITLENRAQIAERFGVTQLHGTKVVG